MTPSPTAEFRLTRDPAAAATAVSRLERLAFPDPWPHDELATLLASGAVIATLAFDAASAGEPAAYALFQLLPGEAELLRIGVPPERRRRGIGRRLLAWSLEELRAGGRTRVHLEVRADNQAALGLYRALGFSVAGRRRGYYADGMDALRLSLDTDRDRSVGGG